jgi:hypothetical protein
MEGCCCCACGNDGKALFCAGKIDGFDCWMGKPELVMPGCCWPLGKNDDVVVVAKNIN